MVFNLPFPNNTILPCFLFFFIIAYTLLQKLQIFIPTVELVIPIGTQTNEANAEIEPHPAIAES